MNDKRFILNCKWRNIGLATISTRTLENLMEKSTSLKFWVVPRWSKRQLKVKQVGPGVLESTQRSEKGFRHKDKYSTQTVRKEPWWTHTMRCTGINKGCVTLWPCHLDFKSILRQKKNYENSNISPCKNIIFKKNPLKETKILQDIITL